MGKDWFIFNNLHEIQNLYIKKWYKSDLLFKNMSEEFEDVNFDPISYLNKRFPDE